MSGPIQVLGQLNFYTNIYVQKTYAGLLTFLQPVTFVMRFVSIAYWKN